MRLHIDFNRINNHTYLFYITLFIPSAKRNHFLTQKKKRNNQTFYFLVNDTTKLTVVLLQRLETM